MLNVSHFFHDSAKDSIGVIELMFTPLLVPETDDSGRTVFVEKVAELIDNPYKVLSFEDFNLQNLLKSGISYKAITLCTDNRIGKDAEIDAFNEHLESIASDLFNSNNE